MQPGHTQSPCAAHSQAAGVVALQLLRAAVVGVLAVLVDQALLGEQVLGVDLGAGSREGQDSSPPRRQCWACWWPQVSWVPAGLPGDPPAGPGRGEAGWHLQPALPLLQGPRLLAADHRRSRSHRPPHSSRRGCGGTRIGAPVERVAAPVQGDGHCWRTYSGMEKPATHSQPMMPPLLMLNRLLVRKLAAGIPVAEGVLATGVRFTGVLGE